MIEARSVSALIPYARNSRTHSEAQVAQIAASIAEFGMVGSIVVRDGVIAKGHGTLLAIRALYGAGKRVYPAPGGAAGAEAYPTGTAPVLDVSGWSDTQFRAYVIADNKLALNAGWDDELLKLELHALADADFQLDLTGFDADELSTAMFDDPAGDPADKDDDEVNFNIGYNLVFDSEGQQADWFNFLRMLKQNFASEDTIGARLSRYLKENGLGAA